jgi:hypothetical protein
LDSPAARKKGDEAVLNRKSEEEENQDHEFILCFDIFLLFNIIFQYYDLLNFLLGLWVNSNILSMCIWIIECF